MATPRSGDLVLTISTGCTRTFYPGDCSHASTLLAVLLCALVTVPLSADEQSEPGFTAVGTEWDGTWRGTETSAGHTVSFDVVSNKIVKVIYGGAALGGSNSCQFDTFLTPQPGYSVDTTGSFTFLYAGSIGVTGTGNLTAGGNGTGLFNFRVAANAVPGNPSCNGTGSASFRLTRTPLPLPGQSWDGTWRGTETSAGHTVSFDVVSNKIVKVIYGGAALGGSNSCQFDTFLTPQPGYPVDGAGSSTFGNASSPGVLGTDATSNFTTAGTAKGMFVYTVPKNSVPGNPSCEGSGYSLFNVTRVGGPPPPPTGVSELLLALNQVAVSVTWRNQYNGKAGSGTPVAQLDQYGYFWFDTADNPEVFVKVLDFGGASYLVFHSALSDLEYTVHFRVLRTGQTYSFKRDPGSVCGLADGTTVKK